MLGIVTGLTAEARIAGCLGRTEIGGGTFAGALAAAERLAAIGVSGLLSFGLAGGLDPALRPGDLVTPAIVLEDGASHQTDPALLAALGVGITRKLLGFDVIVSGAGYKAGLFQSTGACAVDLESGAVARVAARHRLPFAVLRAVCDPADRTLTPAALAGLNARGGVAIGAVLLALLRQPGELPALLELARDAARARKSLVGRVDQIRLGGGLML